MKDYIYISALELAKEARLRLVRPLVKHQPVERRYVATRCAEERAPALPHFPPGVIGGLRRVRGLGPYPCRRRLQVVPEHRHRPNRPRLEQHFA